MSEHMITWDQDADGVVTLTMDDPQARVNTMNERYQDAMDAVVDRLVQRGKEQGRSDDNEETIRTRLGVYRDETAPLIQHYGDQIISIDAVGDVDEINQRAMEALGK